MEFWGIEVKPGESFKVEPEEGRLIHISQFSLGEVKDAKSGKNVLIRLKIDGKDMVIGTLAAEDRPQIMCDLVFDREFELSHGSKNASVYFLGYEADDPANDEEIDDMSDSDEEEETITLPQATKAEPTKTEAAKKPETPKVETEIPAADEDDSDSDDESDEEGDEDDSDSGEDGSDSESEEEAPLVPPPSKKRPAESPKNNAAAGKKAKPNQKGGSPFAAKGNGKPQQGNKFNKGQKGKAGGQRR